MAVSDNTLLKAINIVAKIGRPVPTKDVISGESVALFCRHLGRALELRRNNPRVVPEVHAIAHLALVEDQMLGREEADRRALLTLFLGGATQRTESAWTFWSSWTWAGRVRPHWPSGSWPFVPAPLSDEWAVKPLGPGRSGSGRMAS